MTEVVVAEDLRGIGEKTDAGKPMVGLLIHDMARALWAVAEVATYGVTTGGHPPTSWKTIPAAKKRYADAKFRHELKAFSEDFDKDSKLLHMAHACWNSLALLQLKLESMSKESKNES